MKKQDLENLKQVHVELTTTTNEENDDTPQHPLEDAERLNGWLAMLGFIAGIGAYATTGQLIPGIF